MSVEKHFSQITFFNGEVGKVTIKKRTSSDEWGACVEVKAGPTTERFHGTYDGALTVEAVFDRIQQSMKTTYFLYLERCGFLPKKPSKSWGEVFSK